MSLDNCTKTQTGMGLIEALVTLVVLSIGLLGIAALQITSLKLSANAQWHSQAVWFSYEMTDRITANRSAFAQYNGIDTDKDYDMDCKAAACTPAQMVTADAQAWKELLTSLPGGRGIISSSGADLLTVSVMWDEGANATNCNNAEPDSDGKTCYTVITVR